jgi:hypothetical protein
MDQRRRALGLDGAPAPRPSRESLAASLARIPDLDPSEPPAAALAPPAARRGTAPSATPAPDGPTPPDGPITPGVRSPAAAVRAAALAAAAPTTGGPGHEPSAADAPPPAEVSEGSPPLDPGPATPSAAPAGADAAAAPVPAPAGRRRRIAPPPKPPWWRRVAFALSVLVLVAAIPALVVFGSQLIADSRDGTFNSQDVGPTDPGFEAQVDPTPTALAISYDDENVPNGLTFLSLSGADGGGSVLFVPLDTEVADPKFGIGNIRVAWEATPSDQPALGRDRLTSQVAQRLNVGISETIELTNSSWEQLVAPVAPLQIDNPDTVELGFGVTIPSGPTELPAELVGQYLAARLPNESDIARLVRHEVVWEAWLDQVAAAGRDDAVPGETTAGIGRFARQLAAGPVEYATIPVEEVEGANVFQVDESALNALITDAVASPTAAFPGSRFTVRLLNGVSADAIPSEVVRALVGRGGAVTVLGNGPEFGRDETTIVYANEAMEDVAAVVATSLGATGEVRLDREAPDTVDLTIVLGRDILGDATGSGEPGATTPETLGGN